MELSLPIPNRKPWSVLGVLILAILHTVGLVGMHFEVLEPLFKMLTPVNLMLSSVIVLLYHKEWNARFFLLFFVVFAFGWTIEWVGVHSGVLFGEYEYGSTLGWKIDQIPLLMGLNWWILIYSISKMLQGPDFANWLKALLGAALMVFLDLFMEPVAVRYDFWTWYGETVPLQNYITWFVASFLLFLWVIPRIGKSRNPVASGLYWTQLLFFAGFALVRWIAN